MREFTLLTNPSKPIDIASSLPDLATTNHVAEERLFGRTAWQDFSTLERTHIEACRNCKKLSREAPAVARADGPRKVRKKLRRPSPASAAVRIVAAATRAYSHKLYVPGMWIDLAISALGIGLWLMRSLFMLIAQWARLNRAARGVIRWAGLSSGFSELERHLDVFSAYISDIPANLRPSADRILGPDDAVATGQGYVRAFVQGQDGLPIGLFLRTADVGSRRDLVVFVPPLFAPADSYSALLCANAFASAGHHVAILEPRGSGWTDWWSPGALITGGYIEGYEVLRAIEQIRSQLGAARVARVHVVGMAHGASIALWALYHDHKNELATKVRAIDAMHLRSPHSHLGAILNNIQPQNRSKLDFWTPDYDIRRFFDLLIAARFSRLRRFLRGVTSMRDYLEAANVDPCHLRPEISGDTTAQGRFPGTLLVVADSLRLQARRIHVDVSYSEDDPLIPAAHIEALRGVLTPSVFLEVRERGYWPPPSRIVQGDRTRGDDSFDQLRRSRFRAEPTSRWVDNILSHVSSNYS